RRRRIAYPRCSVICVIRHVELLDRLRRHPVAADLILAVAVAAVGIKSALPGHESAGHSAPVAVAPVGTLPIALRPVFARLVFVVVVVAAVTGALAYDSYWPAGAVVVFYTVAAHLERRESLIFGGTALLALGLAIASVGSGGWQSTLTLLRLAPFAAAW